MVVRGAITSGGKTEITKRVTVSARSSRFRRADAASTSRKHELTPDDARHSDDLDFENATKADPDRNSHILILFPRSHAMKDDDLLEKCVNDQSIQSMVKTERTRSSDCHWLFGRLMFATKTGIADRRPKVRNSMINTGVHEIAPPKFLTRDRRANVLIPCTGNTKHKS
jgi:hypothetical protein